MNSTALRSAIIRLAGEYAQSLPDRGRAYQSPGGVWLFPPHERDGQPVHGNFFPPSYAELIANPNWRRRLGDPHKSRNTFPPPYCDTACDVDSCTSSAAILLSVLGWQEARKQMPLWKLFGLEDQPKVDFEFEAKVAWTDRRVETSSTMVDMLLTSLTNPARPLVVVEAKLTEPDFTTASTATLSNYDRFESVFDTARLLRGGRYQHYQLIRNVLAAEQYNCRFTLLYDGRRDDLLTEWDEVMAAIRDADLRSRCSTVTWQQVAGVAPTPLSNFLQSKYGIAAVSDRSGLP